MKDDQLFSQLRSKYEGVIAAAPQLGIQLQNVHMENGKLLIRGRAPSESVKNEIWNRIKDVDSTYSDLVADISISSSQPQQDLSRILERYADGDDVDGNDDDFDHVAQNAPSAVISQGVAEAFRSDRTPPFPSMLGNLFGQSDSHARAGILNQLLGAAGPAVLSRLFGGGGLGGGMGSSAGGGLAGMLGGMFGGGSDTRQTAVPRVTPEQASQVRPEAVEELAREAQQHNPDVIQRVSDFAAEHPMLVKGLGAVAMGIALKHLSGQKRGGFF